MINFSNIFISESFADTVDAAATAAPQTGLMNFVPLILIFLVFYFLLVRPQQKKMKEHQHTLNHLKNGDKVQTTGGIFGVVKSIDNEKNIIELEIASNVVIKVLKQGVAEVAKDKTPAHKSKKDK